VAEIFFGQEGSPIYTFEDKTRKSGRGYGPAPLSDELTAKAQELGRRSFEVLGCYDCARVDIRLDANENLYIFHRSLTLNPEPVNGYKISLLKVD
jgi:D-alanine-D-alanine ligase